MTGKQADAGPNRQEHREQWVDDAVRRAIRARHRGAGGEVGNLVDRPAAAVARSLRVPVRALPVGAASLRVGFRYRSGACSWDFRRSPEVVLRANRSLRRAADRAGGTEPAAGRFATSTAPGRFATSTALRLRRFAPRRGILSSPIDGKLVYHPGGAVSLRIAGEALSR